MASAGAIVVEGSVIYHVWIKPAPGHSGFGFYEIPVFTALPLFLCLSMQIGVRKALRSGGVSPKSSDTIQVVCGVLILSTYQAIGAVLRLIG